MQRPCQTTRCSRQAGHGRITTASQARPAVVALVVVVVLLLLLLLVTVAAVGHDCVLMTMP